MFLKSKFFRVSMALSLVLCMCAFVPADTIRLKDGSIIKGRIVAFGNGQFTVLIGDGARARQMSFYADEVEAVEFDNAPTATATPRISETPFTNTAAANNSNANANRANNNTIIVVPSNSNSAASANTVNANTPVIVNANVNTNPPANKIIVSNANTNPINTSPISANINANQTVVANMAIPANTTVNSKPKPISLNVKVLADNTANGWTNTGWVVKKGQKIRITGKGQVNLGGGNFAKPEGIKSLADKDKLMKDQGTGALIAVIGDNNNEFIYVGQSHEFVAARDGMLFLGVNEGNLEDNSGSYDVTIEIDPTTN